MWLLLAHLYVLVGTAEGYSAHPSLFGEAPRRSTRMAGLLWDHGWLLCPLGPLSWLTCVGGISEVAMSTGVAALKSALYVPVQVIVTLPLYRDITQLGPPPRTSICDIQWSVHYATHIAEPSICQVLLSVLRQRRVKTLPHFAVKNVIELKKGDVRLRGQTGVPAERRGSYPFIDFRLLNNTTHSGEIGTKKKVKRLLSFQRYFHASRLLRGITPQAPLHLLDEDYLGQARHMLSKVDMWDFDIFLFDRLTNGNSLVTLLCHLFNAHGLIHHFKLDMVTLHRFLVMVQEDYHSQNPYHNAVHAADVTQAMHCYLKEPKLASFLTPLDIMLGLLAAAAHDVDHPGVSQPFLIKTNHHLANLYQNMSVLENHHWRSTVGMLRESRLLAHLPKEMTQDIEHQLGSLILATDINRQNEFLTRLKAHLHNKDLRLEDVHDRHFMLQIALKCADICNPCRIWEMSKQWSERVCEEFYRQGDLEQKFELEISPFCNQQKDSIPSIQIGFMTYIVEPLFREWARFTGHSALSENMLSHLSHNKAQWKSLLPTPLRSNGSAGGGGGPDRAGQGTGNAEQTGTEGSAP